MPSLIDRRDAKTRRPVRGFTLVELLVVIGIIALLIAILLPSLNRAREQAKRVHCSANLHNWGNTCHMFAAQNKGYFPVAFAHAGGPHFPSMLNYDERFRDNYPAPDKGQGMDAWKKYGTTLETFLRFGVARGSMPAPTGVVPGGGGIRFAPGSIIGCSLVCPSANVDLVQFAFSDYQWGDAIWGNYMYMGGIAQTSTNYTPFNDLRGWGNRPPAVKQSDKDASRRVLAADEVYWTTSPEGTSMYSTGGSRYRINHRFKGDPTRPELQNILFADGHVEGFGKDYYRAPTASKPTLGTDNYSMYTHGKNYFYWAGEADVGNNPSGAATPWAKRTDE